MCQFQDLSKDLSNLAYIPEKEIKIKKVKVYVCIMQQIVQNQHFLSNNGSPNDVSAILPKIRKTQAGTDHYPGQAKRLWLNFVIRDLLTLSCTDPLI